MTVRMLPHLESFSVDSKDYRDNSSVLEHFPEVDPKVLPLGTRVLCQLVTTKSKSSGGIVLVHETKETEHWNNQVARVLALGPLAFCNRETGKPWTEGMWCQPGDFVIIPRWGGQRRTVHHRGKTEEPVYFVTVNDHEIIEKVYGNPLELETYIL
jgi:co-chaperonin GroES (HSP10)